MNFRQLEQFLAIAETGSFSRGAVRAGVSQPALSTAIGKLEEELGVRLFNRQARHVVLTREGRQLLSSAKRIVGECEAVRAALRPAAELETLSIGICETLDLPAIAATLEQFRRRHGAFSLKVREAPSGELVDRLAQGRLDIAFLAQIGGESRPPGWRDHRLSGERYVIVAPRDHRLAGQKSASLSVLHDQPFISRAHCEYREVFSALLSERAIRPRVTYRTAHDHRALELIRAGLGVGVFPESLVGSDLHALEVEDAVLERETLCCWPEAAPSAALRAFLAFGGFDGNAQAG